MGHPATPTSSGPESRGEQLDLLTRLDSGAVMSLLAAGVPLTLLIDLAAPTPSQEILATEGGNAQWLRAHVA
jgi:hypothetical protein